MSNPKDIIKANKNNIAFIIGNGINRYNSDTGNSWDALLDVLWERVFGKDISRPKTNISLTEIYDLLDLEISRNKSLSINLQSEFCNLMSNWSHKAHHIKITSRIRELNAPILTTNFESILSDSIELNFNRVEGHKFTDFYPWSCYYGDKKISSPIDDFGIWHINGMEKYYRSIRLGLSHYMGSVTRARRYMHSDRGGSLFGKNNFSKWEGSKTWLHIIFNKSIFIFGLGLEANEVFLRWLLIERAKCFIKYPDRKCEGWYLDCSMNNNEGKKLFLENVGIKYIKANGYEEIYHDMWQESF